MTQEFGRDSLIAGSIFDATMNTSLDEFRNELRRTWKVRNAVKWSTSTFSPEKAFVCSVFSKIAYLSLKDFELGDERAKVVPCETFQELASRREKIDLALFLQSADIGGASVVEDDRIVAVVLPRHDVIFVALRGTVPTHADDWSADFRATKTSVSVNATTLHFHTGFYTAATAFFERLAARIDEVSTQFGMPRPPVYVVGHSLGGAMAGIVFGLSHVTRVRSDGSREIFPDIRPHLSFTFGMPRYGDDAVVSKLRTPFHSFSPKDVVPTVPPRIMGFKEVPREYAVKPTGLMIVRSRPREGLLTAAQRGDIRNHYIERYIERIGSFVS